MFIGLAIFVLGIIFFIVVITQWEQIYDIMVTYLTTDKLKEDVIEVIREVKK